MPQAPRPRRDSDPAPTRRGGTCTLLDFGILKALYDIGLAPAPFSSGPKAAIGTPVYLAFEMASDRSRRVL